MGITVSRIEEQDAYSVSLLDTEGQLDEGECYEALQDSLEDISNVVDIIEWYIDQKEISKTKEELKKGFVVYRNNKKDL